MANAWGELSWNSGLWGQQSDAIAAPTGIGLTSSVGDESAFNNSGWGRQGWNTLSWGVDYQDATIEQTGFGLTSSLNNVGISGEINSGWGRLTFGENAWGIQGDVLVTGIGLSTDIGLGTVTATAESQLTGEQLSLNLNSVTAFGLAEVDVVGFDLSSNVGTADAGPDAMLTGVQASTTVGTVDAYNNEGWGRTFWGTEVWGATGLWAFGNPTGIQLSLTLDNVIATPNTLVDLTGTQLSLEEGIVDPSPDATVVGIGLSASLAVGSVIEANANIDVTGISMSVDLGTAVLDAVTFAEISGQQLNFALNSAVAGASAEVSPTGVDLTVNLGSVNIQSWQIVDTGSDVTWNIIDTAA